MSSQTNKIPISIYHLIDFYPPFIGGLELHSYEIEELLAKKDVKTLVISRKIDESSKDFEYWGSIPVRRITPTGQLRGKGWKALPPILILITKLFFILIKDRKQYNIILVSSLKVLSIPAIIAKSLFNKKCVIMVASPDELGQDVFSDESLRKMKISRSSILVKLIRGIRNPLLERTDAFVVFSSEIRQQFNSTKVNPDKINIIPNGININKFCPVSDEEKMKLRKELSLPENKTIFCYTGRIAKAKGIMNLAEVWKEISQKYSDLYLIFAGSGEGSYDYCGEELRQYIKDNKLTESTLATGYVEEMHKYLQASDAFVFPSDYEGFGLAILEGLACGLPAVLTKVGAAAEVINNYQNGVVVPPKNKKELYNGIEWMLEHKNMWPDMGSNARVTATNFSLDAEAVKYYNLFSEISGIA